MKLVSILTVLVILPVPALASGVRHEMLVTTEWLADHLDAADVVILHVAASREGYDAGHVPGASFLPWETISVPRGGVPNEFPDVPKMAEAFAALGLGTTRRIVLYDETQGIPAARAFLALDLVGLGDRAALLDGQLAKWKAEDRPLSTEAPEARPAVLDVSPAPRAVTPLDEMERLYGASAASPAAPKLVDARPESHYTGEEPGRGIPRGGHIPSAVHVYWKEHLKGEGSAVLRPAAELLALYRDAGVEPGDRVVTYCRSGGQASHTYFTLRYLGFDVSMYDGSFIEWTAAEGRPVTPGPEPR